MNNTFSIHPFNDPLVFVGLASGDQKNSAVFIGQVVPVACTPSNAGDVKASVWNVGGEATLGKQTNPCIRRSSRALAIGVRDGGLVVQNDVFIRT